MTKRGNQGTSPPNAPYDKRTVYIPPDIRVLKSPMLEQAIKQEIRKMNKGG